MDLFLSAMHPVMKSFDSDSCCMRIRMVPEYSNPTGPLPSDSRFAVCF